MSSPHPIDVHVGKRLRLRRTITGMSQEALGNAIGVTFQQIQKYERGINRIGSSRLYEFSRVLRVPVSFFFEEYQGVPVDVDYIGDNDNVLSGGLAEEESPKFEYENDRLSSRETLEMMRAYYRIASPNLRKKIFELIKALGEVEVPENVA